MAATPESPFKHDEPVGTSCKWIAVTTGWLAYALYLHLLSQYNHMQQLDFSFQSIPYSVISLWKLVSICVHILLVGMGVVAVRAAWQCRRYRSFDVMGRALRAQRRFWMCFGAYGAVLIPAMILSSLNLDHFNLGIRNYIEGSQPVRPAR
jgi:hypothetical protein